MTGQEVWKAWEDNPNLEFESVITKEKIVLKHGEVYWKEQSELVSVAIFMRRNWYPTKVWRKVTFLEAIVAWREGHVIKSVNKNGLDFMGMPLFRSEANDSDWYVKEESCKS